ncbi:HDOD domain-containing protein, partial [Fibrobacterota bacterium]
AVTTKPGRRNDYGRLLRRIINRGIGPFMEMREKILSEFEHLENLPVFPETAQKLISTLEDPDSSAADIAKLVQYDPAISAAILKVVNSAYYNPGQASIGNIKQAVARIGVAEIRKICMAFGAMKVFEASSDLIDLRAFWKHCIGVAFCTKVVFKRLGEEEKKQKDAFTAGLFHDIGILILDQFFPDEYRKIRTEFEEDRAGALQAENSALGINHGEIGSLLLQKWKFPSFIWESAAWHHEPDRSSEDNRQLCQIVHLSDFTVSSSGEQEPGEGMPSGFSIGAWYDLGLEVEDIAGIIKEVDEEMRAAKALAALGTK